MFLACSDIDPGCHTAQTYMRQNEFEALHMPILMLNSDALACMYMQALGPDKNVAL